MEKTLSSQATDWHEGRRLRAYELKQQGWKQTQIADALGVTEGAVSQWMKRAREEGVEGLRHKPSTRSDTSPQQPRAHQGARASGTRSRGIRFSRGCMDVREGSYSDP